MIRLIELFSLENYTVFIYGQEEFFLNKLNERPKEDITKNIVFCNTIDECIEKSDIIISGMPLTKDNITVYSPYSKNVIRLDFIQKLINNKLFIAGGIPEWFLKKKLLENNRFFDLVSSEELMILNTIPIVERTIKIAIEEIEDTIYESNILIIGYERTGKVLCQRLKSLGANIYCSARKETDLSWIREARYIPITYEEIKKYVSKMDIVINTVPNIILKEEILNKMNENSLIIDIASKPGGVDKNIAKLYKVRIITALGISKKIAPRTGAKFIKKIIEMKIKSKREEFKWQYFKHWSEELFKG